MTSGQIMRPRRNADRLDAFGSLTGNESANSIGMPTRDFRRVWKDMNDLHEVIPCSLAGTIARPQIETSPQKNCGAQSRKAPRSTVSATKGLISSQISSSEVLTMQIGAENWQ